MAWISSIRRDQTKERASARAVERDAKFGLVKLSPLIRWTSAAIWERIQERAIPVNALHSRGYPSIGCAPCTRAVQPGEHERAGRWWWEHPETKECGLHVAAPLKIERS